MKSASRVSREAWIHFDDRRLLGHLLHMDMPQFLKMVPHAEVRELSH